MRKLRNVPGVMGLGVPESTSAGVQRGCNTWCKHTNVQNASPAAVVISVLCFCKTSISKTSLRKCRVARKSGESVSCALAHCSANGVKDSRQSWHTSELIDVIPSSREYIRLLNRSSGSWGIFSGNISQINVISL